MIYEEIKDSWRRPERGLKIAEDPNQGCFVRDPAEEVVKDAGASR